MKNFLVSLLICLTGCEIIVKPAPPPNPAGPEVANVLLTLINAQEKGDILSAKDYESTSLKDIITLGTPGGTRLALRLTEIGVPLVESLKLSKDQNLFSRMIELSQWSQNDKVRAEALITAGSFSDPNDIPYIQAALAEQNSAGLRLAAIEALQVGGLSEGQIMLRNIMDHSWSPLSRVLAAQALLSQEDSSGLEALRSLLKDRSWIIRALAAHYLGDYGNAGDFKRLLDALNQESQNDFAKAEMAIGALKLLPLYNPKMTDPNKPKSVSKEDVAYRIREGVIEMAPLVLKPPRLGLNDKLLTAQTINNKLFDLITQRLDIPLDNAAKNDPHLQDLYQMVTPLGLALKTRYSQLSILVAEGLAGTTDPFLRAKLAQLARTHSNSLVRATALLSLGYSQNIEDEGIISEGLSSSDPIVRFGAMEAITASKWPAFQTQLVTIAASDPIPAFRLYAIEGLISSNYAGAKNLLLGELNNSDWPARAMAFWYLGRYGEDRDIDFARNRLGSETNPFVLSEMVLTTERLAPRP